MEEKPWTVGTFRQNAIKIAREIRARGQLPILVGGTNYYIQALLFKDAILHDGGSEHSERTSLEQKWPILGSSVEDMLEELRRVDPVIAARWHPQDGRKIRRSLEIYLTTGKTASETYEQKRKWKATSNVYKVPEKNDESDETIGETEYSRPETESPLLFDPLILWVYADPDVLTTRLDKRVDDMIERGLLREAESMYAYLQKLESKGIMVDQSYGIWAAIGFKEFQSYLKMYHSNSESQETLENLKQQGLELTRIATRQYAKYQTNWVRVRLQKSVADNNVENRFFLLDGTNLTRWSQDVDDPAAKLAQLFLRGEQLPPPESLSDAAKQHLVSCVQRDICARHCQICDKTMMSEVDWEKHVKGKQHRRALKPKIDWRALYPREEA